MPSKKGERKRRPLKWDETQARVLALVFEGGRSQAKIAEDCGIPLRTCEDWIAHPDFQAKLKGMREDLLNTLDALGVSYHRKERRVRDLDKLAKIARQDYEQRRFLREYRPIMGGGERRGGRGGEGRGEGRGEKPRPARGDDLDAGKAIAAVEELFGLKSGKEATESAEPPAEPLAARVIDGLPPGVDPADCIINESFSDPPGHLFRGLLDDIAKEFGDRKGVPELAGEATLPPFEITPPSAPPVDEEYETGQGGQESTPGTDGAATDERAHTMRTD